MNSKMTDDKLKQMVELLGAGLKDRAISKILEVDTMTIGNHRRRLGIQPNGPQKGALVIDANGNRQCVECR